MIKAFKIKQTGKDWHEVKLINMETGEFTSYTTHKKLSFPFGVSYTTTVTDMGYKNVTECIKTLKSRNMLGQKVDYKEQRESERLGYIQLGVERIKRTNRINTLDFEDVIKKLANYGMNYVDAQNVITENYLHLA